VQRAVTRRGVVNTRQQHSRQAATRRCYGVHKEWQASEPAA